MSSSEQDRVRELAERVARRLSDEPAQEASERGEGGGEVAALRQSLSEIQSRLARIESRLARGEAGDEKAHAASQQTPPGATTQPQTQTPAATPARSTWLSGTYVPATAHPSQEQFAGIGEAVSELVEFFEREKTCSVEPGGKPCDHCGMCSSRGF
jgi:hypothetical protein